VYQKLFFGAQCQEDRELAGFLLRLNWFGYIAISPTYFAWVCF